MIKFNYGLYSKYLGVITLCAFRFGRKLYCLENYSN